MFLQPLLHQIANSNVDLLNNPWQPEQCNGFPLSIVRRRNLGAMPPIQFMRSLSNATAGLAKEIFHILGASFSPKNGRYFLNIVAKLKFQLLYLDLGDPLQGLFECFLVLDSLIFSVDHVNNMSTGYFDGIALDRIVFKESRELHSPLHFSHA